MPTLRLGAEPPYLCQSERSPLFGRLFTYSAYLPAVWLAVWLAVWRDCPISALRDSSRVTDSTAISRLGLDQDCLGDSLPRSADLRDCGEQVIQRGADNSTIF